MKEHGHMLNMTGFHCPTTKTLCLASFFICVFNRTGFPAYTVDVDTNIANERLLLL
jgi:hypothetical protein